jgi:hypothetical protein
MKLPGQNSVIVRALYEARGNLEVIREVLAPDVRWDVIEGFPYSDVWTLRDGKIVGLQQCADTAQLTRALGKDFSKEEA